MNVISLKIFCVAISCILQFDDTLHFHTEKEELKWSMLNSDFISSFGSECDILVIQDHKVIRDIYLFEPSLQTIINENSIQGNKIYATFTIEQIEDSVSFRKVDIVIYQNNLNVSSTQEDVIKSICKDFRDKISIDVLKKTSKKPKSTFTVVFKCSP